MDEYEEFRARFAAKLRLTRHERGLRIDDLEDMGITRRVLQKAEQGETWPRLDTILHLAKAYEMDPAELLRVSDVDPGSVPIVTHGGARTRGKPASRAVGPEARTSRRPKARRRK